MTERSEDLQSNSNPSVGEILLRAKLRLEQSGQTQSPRLDSEVLFCHVLDWTKTDLHCRITDRAKSEDIEAFFALVEQRTEGIPVAYLTGWRDFYSRRFWVKPGVLVPRPETECLVEEALRILSLSPGANKILDLCCGSGCVGITMALETLTGIVTLSDIDDLALRQTRENVDYYKLGRRVNIVKSDLFATLPKCGFDLIVSNPPYVGTQFGPRPEAWVHQHEPGVALYSGPSGTEHLKRIIERAPAYLIEGGGLVVECASFQVEKLEAWMDERGFAQTQLWHDLSGLPRGVSGRWEGQNL